MAGKINICCFDKTGTLTQNDLVIRGISGLGVTKQEKQVLHELEKVENLDENTAIVMGGAHTLAFADDALVGDPIEK